MAAWKEDVAAEEGVVRLAVEGNVAGLVTRQEQDREAAISQRDPAFLILPASRVGIIPARTSEDFPLPDVPTTARKTARSTREARSLGQKASARVGCVVCNALMLVNSPAGSSGPRASRTSERTAGTAPAHLRSVLSSA